MTVSRYIQEEVARQGYIPGTVRYVDACIDMARGWEYAVQHGSQFVKLDKGELIAIGALVHPDFNSEGFRRCNVTIAGTDVKFPGWQEVPRLVEKWCDAVHDGALSPLEAYIALMGDIHPFRDGNGRVGKIVFNWLNVTLDDPVLPDSPKEWRVP